MVTSATSPSSSPQLEANLTDGTLLVELGGDWSLGQGRRPRSLSAPIQSAFKSGDVRRVAFATEHLTAGGGPLQGLLWEIAQTAKTKGVGLDMSGLPPSERQLLTVAGAAPQREAEPEATRQDAISRLGQWVLNNVSGGLEVVDFTGQWVQRFWALVLGRGVFRWKDFWQVLRQVSADALPIVTLISFLVGLIIAFLGAVVLMRFGAEFAVAYLVGYGMLREMGAVMTGVIMAGRTGAAFAAQLGSMKVNEELDALTTFGISPMDFLVVPRIVALTVMMPLLVIYANVVGIFAGYLVADGLMGVPGSIFFTELTFVVGLADLFLGIFKGVVFGLLVATAGCLRGLQSGSGADAVGEATTRSVVTGITLIIFANAVIDWAAATLQI